MYVCMYVCSRCSMVECVISVGASIYIYIYIYYFIQLFSAHFGTILLNFFGPPYTLYLVTQLSANRKHMASTTKRNKAPPIIASLIDNDDWAGPKFGILYNLWLNRQRNPTPESAFRKANAVTPEQQHQSHYPCSNVRGVESPILWKCRPVGRIRSPLSMAKLSQRTFCQLCQRRTILQPTPRCNNA